MLLLVLACAGPDPAIRICLEPRPAIARCSAVAETTRDGEVVNRATHYYDEAGSIAQSDFDYEPDGVIDMTFEYVRDRQGNVLAEAIDYDADGNVDERTTYTWADGHVASKSVDHGNDGEVDVACDGSWERFSEGEVAHLDCFASATGEAWTETTRTTMDSSGLPILHARDADGDGHTDETEVLRRDFDCLVVEQERVFFGSETLTSLIAWVYDDAGRALRADNTFLWNVSGHEWSLAWDYVWSCPS